MKFHIVYSLTSFQDADGHSAFIDGHTVMDAIHDICRKEMVGEIANVSVYLNGMNVLRKYWETPKDQFDGNWDR